MFDGSSEFAAAAEALAKAEDEGSRRSAISRAYYSAYWHARRWLNLRNGLPEDARLGHAEVWDKFGAGPRRVLRHSQVYNAGKRLMIRREIADYDADPGEIERLDDAVQDAIDSARQIREWIDQIRP